MANERIRVVIADDEPIARRGIRQLLAAHGDVEIVGEARNGKEAVRLLDALAPDLVFLDIQMPEIDGFDVVRRAADRRLQVIFVTAYDSFAVAAFDANAVDYLVKPVGERRFDEALARARERLRARAVPDPSRAVSELPSRDGAVRRMVLGTPGSDVIVEVRDITCIAAADYYAVVHFAGRRSLVRESLESIEKRLDPARFVRTHRGFIVNLEHVAELRATHPGDSAVVLRDGMRVPLSRRRRQRVEAAIRQFVG
jgi:two-component system LytT family response regulator